MRKRAEPEVLEDVLEPELPIVDAHYHLWDRDASMQREDYHLDHFIDDLASGHNIESTVFVEAEARYRPDGPAQLRCVGETEFANASGEEAAALGLKTRIAAGIVAYADLDLGADVDAVLDAHQAAAPDRLRGIRDMAALDRSAPERDPHRLLQPDFRQGLRRLAARGLTFDLYVFQVQLGDAIATVRALPEVTFVLNHLGGLIGIRPWVGRRDELWAQWHDDIATIAREPNVYLKLGGLNMFIPGFNWHHGDRLPSSTQLVDATGKYYSHGIESFGPGRCMFGSNFPPDKLSGSYRTLWNSFKLVASVYTAEEKAAMFAGTASRVYRL
ncbi:amidohydrolase family protein [Pseudofrankia sp. BMG5.36]|uniref:amidohydrolase family protein n=1 Tax=Pseudofrankia sp. BMG5.36 TaxID=1834512 RepID=UPI0008D9A707|nr:amidohydrolase family protein [Pseudofrankia sp. BMG5.36]OHV64847.1 hypothetical protein BCD48_37130 [Pseudofrankia sp. BMG5.36]